MTAAHDNGLRAAIRDARRASETACLRERLQLARLEPGREQRIQKRARRLAKRARNHALRQTGLEAFLQEYDLSSREGVLLMCIAEALLRVPDTETADRLISDRLSRGHWDDHLGASSSVQPGISVKLSALHSRYEYSQRERVLRELLPRVQLLIEEAMTAGINLTLDAEEADNLELSLDLFERLVSDLRDCSWQGLGLAVQAYQKSALPVLQWLHHLAQKGNRRLQVRLVKGAYWDTEIKRAQQRGLDSYPVFTRKAATDVSYLACARFLMRNTDLFYPQMASHNALTRAYRRA